MAALLTGLAMSVLADELMTPLLGFSAPNRAFLLVTHLRGVAAHLVFGATVGAVSEATWAITGRLRPTSGMAVPQAPAWTSAGPSSSTSTATREHVFGHWET